MIQQFDAWQRALAPYPWTWAALALVALIAAAWLANWITRHVLLRGLQAVLRSGPFAARVQAHGVRLRVIPRLANVVPALVMYGGVSVVPGLPPALVTLVRAACEAFIVLTVALALSKVLDLLAEAYERRGGARERPIKGYVQIAKIVLFCVAGLSIVATLAGVPFVHLVTGLGAISAVLLLVFQDTILSLVASAQIGSDGRVRLGDWIEMPSQNADGEVIDLALHTVTVQNWDKTIVTIPTRKLISESFRNWRGMSESGGRRIKRALWLDQNSVRFLDARQSDRLDRFALLHGYLRDKRDDIARWNAALAAGRGDHVNHRRMTNLGSFRAYVERYLRAHPGIHQGMTLLVRQLPPGSNGLPLEIYCFTCTVDWNEYEAIQSDVFDHLLAILPEFGLQVFQAPGGADVRAALLRPEEAAQRASPAVADASRSGELAAR